MDPNETLKKIRELIKDEQGDYFELAELIDSLDQWLSRGGYLPKDWLFNW